MPVTSRFLKGILPLLLLCGLPLIVFLQTAQHDFIHIDDHVYVFYNPHVTQGLSSESVSWALRADLTHDDPNADYWRPLTFLSHMLDVSLFGLDAGKHHLMNLLLHILNCLLLYLLLLRVSGSRWKSLLAAALFAVHPLQVEPVAWISARKDLLSGTLGFLTLHFHISSKDKRAFSPFRLLALVFLILSLTAKAMMVILPGLMLLLDFWKGGKDRPSSGKKNSLHYLKESLLTTWPCWIAVFIFCPIPFIGQRLAFEYDPLLHFQRALESCGVYFMKFFFPVSLGLYGPAPSFHVSAAALILSLGILTGISLILAGTLPKSRTALIGWLWFLGSLVPVIALPWPADRFMYFPLIGLSIFLIWGLSALIPERLALLTAAIGVLICLPLSDAQTRFWKDDEQIMTRALEINPDNYVIHNNFGNVLDMQGRYLEAFEHYAESLRIFPGYHLAHYNLAKFLLRQGDHSGALYHAGEVIRLAGDFMRVKRIREEALQALKQPPPEEESSSQPAA